MAFTEYIYIIINKWKKFNNISHNIKGREMTSTTFKFCG